MAVCSSAFSALGRAQAKALGCPGLPIAVIPHPFGNRTRDGVRAIAEECAEQIARLACEAGTSSGETGAGSAMSAHQIEIADEADAINRLCRERRWTDGLPIVPPTPERIARMLGHTSRAAHEIVATLPPCFGDATAERIAINAVMAGCDPEYLPVLIAAVDALTAADFNLQAIQTTTNPATVWLIVNGPIVDRLQMNAGINCLGPGNWANATLGRALRLVLQNIGGARAGETDLATHGQPGKYLFCCPESEATSPWEPLHVERGMRSDQSAVTVVGAEGTVNLNTHTKNADELLRVIADSMPRPTANDYRMSGEPWIILAVEHAEVLKAAGLGKKDIKRALWEQSKMPAHRMARVDMEHMMQLRRAELGVISPDTLLPISPTPDHIGIIVAGGSGTHSLYVPRFGNTRSVTREVML